jgi:hypothetical protein
MGWSELERDFQPESFTSLYGAVLPDSRLAISCESKYATVWRYWNGVCYHYHHGNSPYSPTYKEDQTGLRLYRDIQGGSEGYDCGLLERFFAYKQHANSAEANYEGIQAEVHNTISNKLIRELVGYILLSSAAFATKLPLQLNTFAASFFSSQQICRRGQDHYNQTLCQRYGRHVWYIGPKPEGTECTFIIARRSKTNLGERRQITTCPDMPVRRIAPLCVMTD